MIRLAALALVLAVAGCGGSDAPPSAATPTPAPTRTATATPEATPRPARRLRAPRCRPEVPDCARVSGRIVYVERVDPDGDGDAHFVVLDRRGVTAPGITVVDVARELRPRPLPGAGELLSAAGPVYPGSYGQAQIEADVVRVARP